MAEKLLAGNHESQRRKNPAHVAMLASRILAGSWDPYAGALVVDASGRLVDGQHRCAAVVASGTAVSVPIIFGAVSRYRDDGRRRSVADRTGKNERLVAVARFCGLGIFKDPDVSLSVFGPAIESSGLLSIPTSRPFGCSAAISGAFAAEIIGSGLGLSCLSRLCTATPSGRKETAVCRAAQAGKFTTTGAGAYAIATAVFNAAAGRVAEFAEIRSVFSAYANERKGQ